MTLAPILILAGVLAAVGAFIAARDRLNDAATPVVSGLTLPGEPPRVMAIWAHPDDEVAAAGALYQTAQRPGAHVVIVHLTAGEAARASGLPPTVLAEARRGEAQAAGRLLGAAKTYVLNFPDGGLCATAAGPVKSVLSDLIDQHRPAVLVSFDDRVGYYGHPDHVQAGRWVREIFQERCADDAFTPLRLYQATLPPPLIALARRHVKAFRDRYPENPDEGLPPPSIGIRIVRSAAVKRRLLDVHKTQAQVMADVQPFYDKVPAWLYYRLFDREYFALAEARSSSPSPARTTS